MNYSKILIGAFILTWLTACTYTERITNGSTAFERKQYSVAIPMLEKEYTKEKDVFKKGRIAYLLAESYRKNNAIQEAVDWYLKAQQNRYGSDTDLNIANCYQQLEQYNDAKKAFRTAGRFAGNANLYREEIQACQNALQWKALRSKNAYKVTNLEMNSKANDFSPSILNNAQLLFSSDRSAQEDEGTYKWTGSNFFDLYTLQTTTQKIEAYERVFNKAYHQGTLVFNKDKSIALFTQCGSKKRTGTDYCQLMIAQKTDTGWTTPSRIPFELDTLNIMHPALNSTGDMLTFACNNPKGFGGYDLYKSTWSPNLKKWSKPANMGSRINSKGNDVFPYWHQDTLYYSSDGRPGMGGLDIFRIELKNGRWSKVKNMKAPINSGGDDFGIVFKDTKSFTDSTYQIGYLSSNRLGGKGGDDLYQFNKVSLPAPPPVAEPAPVLAQIYLNGRVDELLASGDSIPLMGASIQISSQDTVFTIGSDVDGSFEVALKAGQDYNLNVTKPNYFTNTDTVLTTDSLLFDLEKDTTLYTVIALNKIIKNQEIVLENIYYDYDKWDIRADAMPTLDELYITLQQNPSIKIELGSHTDCRGRAGYNETLSQKRAESAVQYLMSKGIMPDRLRAKGYGETKPSALCECADCSEEQHQKNRRTTFKVID